MFIANKNSGITEIKEIAGLQQLKNYSFTFAFGSELSTSGRLMPQYFLKQAEVHLKDFQGEDRPQCKRTLRGEFFAKSSASFLEAKSKYARTQGNSGFVWGV